MVVYQDRVQSAWFASPKGSVKLEGISCHHRLKTKQRMGMRHSTPFITQLVPGGPAAFDPVTYSLFTTVTVSWSQVGSCIVAALLAALWASHPGWPGLLVTLSTLHSPGASRRSCAHWS